MGQKGQAPILVLAGIVLSLALASGIFYLGRISAPKPQPQVPIATPSPQQSPTSDPTANWKTYKNTKYGYSLKYPPDWAIYTGSEGRYHESTVRLGPMVEQCPSNINSFTCVYAEIIDITIKDNPENLSIEEFVDPNDSYNMKYKPIPIAGVVAKRISDRPGQFENEDVYIKRAGKIYEITLIKNLAPKRILPEIFNQILSTFKFLP